MKPQQHDYHSPLLQHHFQKLSSNNKKEPFANSSPPTTITTSATTTTTTSSTTLSWDTMDLEILHAQIFGAVQAHTEGSLHLAWDRLADTLGQPALESYIRGIISRHCLNSTITSPALAKSINTNANRGNGSVNENMVLSSCLKSKAAQISAELDGYVRDNLIQIFTILDEDILPQLLANTSKDLTDVLDYFNRLFFNNNEHQYTLRLEVTPWTHHSQTKEEENHILKLKLIPLFDHSLSNDDHLSEFFSNYACLSSA
ncbi:hypothetical protein BDF20DRAFT_880976 [Mycotypha africana]|uniref:uncharacterized protein n=1 Tax=Mycotypha africana TaxID=64632 RepID=UPI0023005CC3|nr:uncharacterized protein BDF20DRAFT_880976 [Mycotypha africana]KAI8973198.1 hypothetical protein BDF20DRAFT_880976 [Mycotypha africana]